MKFVRQFHATYKALHAARRLLGRDNVSKILDASGREARRRGLDRTRSLRYLEQALQNATRAERLTRMVASSIRLPK